jgi:hypothetical protein
MIAVDIDGTLIASGGMIGPRTMNALRAAAESGVEIVIATGRRYSFAMPMVAPLRLKPTDVMITSNGSVVRTVGGELLERTLMPAETAKEICRELSDFTGSLVFTFDVEGRGSLVIESTETLGRAVGRWIHANLDAIETVDPLINAFADGACPIQGMLAGSMERMHAARLKLEAENSALSKQITIHRTEYPERNLSIVDLLPAGCSKGVALERLAGLSGIPREEVMAIGDNWNDLDMLTWAGQPVIMANASDELREIASARGWRVTASNEEDGVGLAVEVALRRVLEFS